MKDDPEYYAVVRLDLQISINLPEGVSVEGKECEISAASKERAIEAALGALPQNINVYIDGDNKLPAVVFVAATEDSVDEVWAEEEL